MSDQVSALRTLSSSLNKDAFPYTAIKISEAADTIESLTSENTRLRALLEEIREEAGEYLFKVGRAGVMGKYDDEDMLYAGPGLLRSIFDRIPPSHKGED